MKISGMEFKCEACGRWSEDDEVCSFCGASIDSEDALSGVFVPGFSKMSEEERRELEKRVREEKKRKGGS